MSESEINQSLEALHTEISKLQGPDTEVKETLLALIKDVEKQLQDPGSSEHKAATVQKLPTLIEQFEADHPQVTNTLGRLLTTLSGMGI